MLGPGLFGSGGAGLCARIAGFAFVCLGLVTAGFSAAGLGVGAGRKEQGCGSESDGEDLFHVYILVITMTDLVNTEKHR